MLMRKFAATSALVIAALGVTAGTVNAAPAPETAVNFTAESTESSTIITTDAGSLVVEDNTFKVKASNGTVLAGTPLSFRVDDFEFPIAADISGRTATLTPQLDMAKAVYKPVALPFEDQANWKSPYDREKDAFNRMKDTISTGATIATLVGGIGGAAVGCVLGGIAGATVASATIIGLFGPFIPAAAVGCIGGILAVGALGTLAGQILITAPVAIGAAIQYFTTINQPFNPPAK
ncbi:hypothetical protein IU438_14065 [Nocardia cyriacigeorgica]|uniref:DUF8020 domain-containing protein n=1 Tax=Nocardia cyriacigeorgica TaxID=135487 RepID=A0A2L2JNY8_9NOCA|nr:hypothetical protein [Nocardia cyriacigeorgica]AVH21348.1 hypothetical protein C5B73_07605 [Nocardia cyriacigeorgica]MBF6086235.1 hypothetical protein [Nocardia cyriacigeorgica]MBF6092326.1 hypothetical protein [Nocardia cyriacigeorgica]MBF6100970.1 hypothetical protein [Nocardia cyriacigeorgica]MBF6162878.1 hypothetical protein [Nocardia cyriacigeorgica]